MFDGLRALVGARVSRKRKDDKGDAKVSHIAQHATGHRWTERHGAIVVDEFEDLDVSADKVSPFDRPDLAPWLEEDLATEWDVMVFSKIDRAFRSTVDCVKFGQWMKKHKKILVFADDGLTLNYLNPKSQLEEMMAELFLYIGAFFAQLEVNQFKDRAVSAHATLRLTPRFAGGTPRDGYKNVPAPDGEGSVLVIDEIRQLVMYQAARWFLKGDEAQVRGGETVIDIMHELNADGVEDFEGDSFNGVAGRLNEAAVETSGDYHREPEDKRKTKWSAGQVIDMLTSPGTQGIKMYIEKDEEGKKRKKNARPVLDKDGNRIQWAAPVFDAITWHRIQAKADERKYGPKSRVNNVNPLLDVVYCGLCEHKGTQKVQKRVSVGDDGEQFVREYRYYNCANPHSSCEGVNSRAEDVETLLEQTFLEECGHLPVTRRQFDPGYDATVELGQVQVQIQTLRDDRDAGLFKGADDELDYRRRMKGLVERRANLEAQPQRKASWNYVATDELYGAAWSKADQLKRRKMLVDAGVRFVLHGKQNWEVQIPDDIETRLKKAAAEDAKKPDPAASSW